MPKLKDDLLIGALITFFLFLAYFPISGQINFMQNDDWYYYQNVESFLKGIFELHPETAPTFYLQGVFGALFAFIFGLNNLPVLTLAVSTLCFLMLFLILRKKIGLPVFYSVLGGLFLFFNPLFQYSIFGFMTENYFLLALLISFWFFIQFEEKQNNKDLVIFNIFLLLGLLIRQIALIPAIVATIYFGFKRNQKAFFTQLLFTLGFSIFYFVLFPKTPEMTSKGLQFSHLLQDSYVFAIFYGALLYVAAFLIPFFVSVLGYLLLAQKPDFKKIIVFLVISFGIYVIASKLFNSEAVSWGEFPYFENNFERTGFIPREIHGTKYHFRGIFDLYRYWDTTAKILVSAVAAAIITFKSLRQRFSNYFMLFAFFYLGTLFLTYTFYDRYILVLLPPLIITLGLVVKNFTQNKHSKLLFIGINLISAGFVIFLALFSYNFAMDYVLNRNFIWTESIGLTKKGALPNEVYANSAWNEKYGSNLAESSYLFSYDSQKVNPELQSNYGLIKDFTPDYPLNLFINQKVYLYEKNLVLE